MLRKEITIQLEKGLEARPIAVLVQVASQFDSVIYIEIDGKKVNAKSIMGMMSLILGVGEKIVVEATGIDEEKAIAKMEEYLSNKTA